MPLNLLLLLLPWTASSQEQLTLPPACPYTPSSPAPGTTLAPFSLLLTNASTFTYPVPLLPLIVFAVASDDPGGLLLATDEVELDRFLGSPPTAAPATYLLLSYSSGGGAALQRAVEARLALLPLPLAAAWRSQLAFSAQSVPELGMGAGASLAAVLGAWQSPRLWVTAGDGRIKAARVDGFYECFLWPPAAAAYTLHGPFTACTPLPPGAPTNLTGFVLLAFSAITPCSPPQAVAWAQLTFPSAAGAVVPTPTPALIGRDCTDTFVDAPFFPVVVDTQGGDALAAALASSPNASIPMSLNYTCSGGTALVVAMDGTLAPLGWRKYTEASALLWAAQEQVYQASLSAIEQQQQQGHGSGSGGGGGGGVVVQPLLPPHTPLRATTRNVTLAHLPIGTLRAATGATLSFKLQCEGLGDNACGPWDRIISAFARCFPEGGGAGGTGSVEIARWITPFRRSGGAWHTAADALLGLVGNGSATATGVWTCEITTSSCCEEWYGQLDLLVFTPPAGDTPSLTPSIPFATLPLLFPNAATHFDKTFNANRTLVLTLPPAFSSMALFAVITGHGSDPPPPAALGCEYAPTEHTFSLGPPGQPPTVLLNSSTLAPAQYLEAGSMLGCVEKVPLGVIANQHGDWRDGRNGWCPGQGVVPLLFQGVQGATLGGLAGEEVQVTYTAYSFYDDLSHKSEDGCGGDIQWSAALLFY